MSRENGFFRNVKVEIRRRADYTCEWCGSPEESHYCHHRVPVREGGRNDHPINGANLCGDCHTEADIATEAGYVLVKADDGSQIFVPIEEVSPDYFEESHNPYSDTEIDY